MSRSHGGIEALPAELLVLIFEHGSQATLHELTLPFSILASHVSRRWRSIVYSTPSAWRAIPSTKPILLAMYLQQSQKYSLDVYIHARPRVGDTGVLEIVNLLLEHSDRWRCLYIRAITAPLLFVVISRLRKAKAPQLERFELFVDAQPHTVGQLPVIFVDDPPPRLSSVTLEGVGFLGFQVPMLSGLTSLTLARLPRGMGQLPYTTFKDLLGSSPRLKHLALDGVIPRLMPDIEYEEIVVPHLHSFDITIPQQCQYIQRLFDVLSLPAIRIFRYGSNWNLAWNHLELALPTLAAKYRNLEELYFTVTADSPLLDERVSTELFMAFPELRTFSLNVYDDTFATYFLQPWIELLSEDGKDEETGESIVVWPKLELLTVRAPYDADSFISLDESLEMLGSLRLSMGLPFDVFQGFIFADRALPSVHVWDPAPPSYQE